MASYFIVFHFSHKRNDIVAIGDCYFESEWDKSFM